MSAEQFVERRLKAFQSGDLESLAADYTPMSMILTPFGNMVGRDQARGMFGGFVEQFRAPGARFEVIARNCKDQVAHFSWRGETATTTFRFGNETYFLDADDKVLVHVFDGDMAPK